VPWKVRGAVGGTLAEDDRRASLWGSYWSMPVDVARGATLPRCGDALGAAGLAQQIVRTGEPGHQHGEAGVGHAVVDGVADPQGVEVGRPEPSGITVVGCCRARRAPAATGHARFVGVFGVA
jgi:hypothetical protein